MTQPLFEFNHISKKYSSISVLNHLNFHVNQREILGIIGTDSAGKSTISRIISGLESSDNGEIKYLGEKAHFHNKNRVKIELVAAEEYFSPDLDIAHNIFIGRWPRKYYLFIDKKRLYQEARILLEQFHLSFLKENQKIKEISGGYQHMIAVIRAISSDPTLIIYDEPMKNLSINASQTLYNLMNILKKKRISQIMATRRPKEAIQICDRILVMRQGKIVFEADTKRTSEEELTAYMYEG